MYKDVGKRILAFFISICMLLGMADFSVLKVEAAQTLNSARLVLVLNGEDQNRTSQTYNPNSEYTYKFTLGLGGAEVDLSQCTVVVKKDGEEIDSSAPIKAAGNYEFTITANADSVDYSGTRTGTARISPLALTSNHFSLSATEMEVDERPLPTVNCSIAGLQGLDITGDPSADITGVDYTYEYVNIDNVGNTQVVIRGVNSCSTSSPITKALTVRGHEITEILDAQDKYYTGRGNYGLEEGDIEVFGKDGAPLDWGVDYTVSKISGDITKPGEITYRITGLGKYLNCTPATTSYKIIKDVNDPSNTADITVSGFNSAMEYEYTGEPITQALQIRDNGTLLKEGEDYVLKYDANINVTNNTTAMVTIDFDGGTNGYYIGYREFEFRITKADFSKATVAAIPNITYDGEEHPIQPEDITVTLNGVKIEPENYTVTWPGEDITGVGPKKLTITATENGNLSGNTTASFRIVEQALKENNISVEQDSVYDGNVKEPDVTVFDDQNRHLVKDQDYSVVYNRNINATTATSMATVTVTGKGNYSGEFTKTFAIAQQDIRSLSLSLGAAFQEEMTYTGSAINQDSNIEVYVGPIENNNRLIKNTDYTISYIGDQVNVGEGNKVSVQITGQGNYFGTIEVGQFEIVKQSMDDAQYIRASLRLPQNAGIYTTSYTTQNIEPTVVVEHYQNGAWREISQAGNYSLAWTNNREKSTGTDPSDLAKVTITGNGNYTGSTEVYFEITAMDLSLTENANRIQVTFDQPLGSAEAPYFALRNDAVTPTFELNYQYDESIRPSLVQGTDYEIEYADNRKPGTGKIIIKGLGNYKGQCEKTFKIRGSLQDVVLDTAEKVYTGGAIQLVDGDLTFMYQNQANNGEKTQLHLGTDFELDYTRDNVNNINCGTATAYLVEKPGSDFYLPDGIDIPVTFQIIPKNLNDEDQKPAEKLSVSYHETQEYTTKEINPKLTIAYAQKEGGLVLGEDYEIIDTPRDNKTDVGDAYFTIQAKEGSNFTGQRRIRFSIIPRDLSVGTITVADIGKERIYRGEPIKIEDLSFTYTGLTTDGEEFTLSSTEIEYIPGYEDNDQVGDAKLLLTGRGMFAPRTDNKTIEIPFLIKGDLTDEHTEITARDKIFKNADWNLNVDETDGEEDVVVTYYGQKLEYGKHYTLTYPGDHRDAAEAVPFKVVGIDTITAEDGTEKEGYCINEKDDTFTILPKPLENVEDDQFKVTPVFAPSNDYTYTGEPIEPEFVLNYNGEDLSRGTYTPSEEEDVAPVVTGDYAIIGYDKNVNVVEDYENASNEDRPAVLVKAREGGNYTGEARVVFEITPRSIAETGSAGDSRIDLRYTVTDDVGEETEMMFAPNDPIAYEGYAIRLENDLPKFKVFCNDKELVQAGRNENGEEANNDYSISYENNGRPGAATLILTGHGNYADERRIPFKITGDLEKADIDPIPGQPYSMGGSRPKPHMTYYGPELVLEEGVDYELSYRNEYDVALPDDENPPTVIIKGINGFEGKTIEVPYEIIVRDLSIEEDVPEEERVITIRGLREYQYTGEPIEPDKLSNLTFYDAGLAIRNNQCTVVDYRDNINGGTGYLVVEGSGNYTGRLSFAFTITGIPVSDRSVTIQVDQTSVYTGSPIEPAVTVTHNGRQLELGTEYTLEWLNNTNAGRANGNNPPTVIVRGVGNYGGERTVSFAIAARDMEEHADEFRVTVNEELHYNNGVAVEPAPENVTVTRVSGTARAEETLSQDTDYEIVRYTNNVNAGNEAHIQIRGKNNYQGTMEANFTILPADIESAEEIEIGAVASSTYDSKAHTPDLTVRFRGRELTPETDYEVSYSDNVNAGTAKATVKLKGNYAGENSVEFAIEPRSLTDEDITMGTIPNQTYTGSAITPDPEIIYRNAEEGIDQKLVSGRDYRLEYEGNVAVGNGTAKVTVTGTGNYRDTLTTSFNIMGDIATVSVSAIPVQDYTGKPITPAVTVQLGGRTLVAETDYTLKYANNTNPGRASITITGTGTEFGGSKTVYFDICRDISAGLEVEGLGKSYLYTGKAIVPKLGKVSAYGQTLALNKGYKVTVSNNVNVGTASIRVEGTGYYKGSKTFQFAIEKRSIAQCTVSKVSNKTYNGKEQKPKVTVKYGNITLKEGTDYTLTYLNNTLPGQSMIIVSGKGNMVGSKPVYFNIKMPSLSGVKVTPSSSSKIKVSWKKQSLATGYQIYNNKNKLVATVKGGSKTSYTISGLKAGTAYNYKVRFYVIKGGRTCYSSFTNVIKTSTKPAAPKITVKSSKAKQAVISWKKISGASGYEVYRSTKAKSGFKKVADTKKLKYTNTKLTSKRRYYYRVRAYRTVNGTKIYSSYSTTKYVTIK